MFYGKTFLLITLLILTSFVCKSQIKIEQKADTNLMGKYGQFSHADMWGKNVKISNATLNGQKCLMVTPTGKPARVRYGGTGFIAFRSQPPELKAGRFYTISVDICTKGGAQGKLVFEASDSKHKIIRIRPDRTGFVSSKKWKKIEINLYAPKGNCFIRPMLYSKDSKGFVYWKNFDVRFAPAPQLLYFKKIDNGILNIHGKFDPAYMPKLSGKLKLSVKISLKDPLNQKVVFSKTYQLEKNIFSSDIDISKYDFGIYRFNIVLKNMRKTVFKTKMTYVPGLDCAYKEMESYNKRVNSEVGINIKEAKKIKPDTEEQQRGFILFNRPEPRWIQPDSLPLPDEKLKEFQRTAAPGDYVFFTTALLPLRDLKDVEFSFLPDSDNFPKAQTGMLKYIPQQMHYAYKDRIKKYWIVPEVIDKVKPVNLKQGRVQQYSLRLKVQQNADGKYSGKCLIKVKGKILAEIPVRLKVIPVKLSQPDDVVFGMYVDQIRWTRNKQYTTVRIQEELKDIKEHGYNSIRLAAVPPIIKVGLKNGDYKTDTRYLSQILDSAVKVGFNKQPYILSTYAMERVICKRTGLPAPKGLKYTSKYKKYVDQFFAQLKKDFVKPGLPEPLIQGVDESSHGERLQRSIRKLRAAKEHGFRTTSTVFHWAFGRSPEYEKVVDVRVYSNVGFWEMRTPELADKLRKATAAKGDVFWSYGSGCYANFNPKRRPFYRNVRQEACLTENRYLHGLFVYRAKLKGQWSWTFSRWRGNPLNDFDNPQKRRGEVKDAYIVYPNANGLGYKDTLQWEALRQGWQDYRAVSTLDRLLAKRKDKKAKMIKSEMDKKIAEIPWRNYTQYPNEKLDNLREWFLEKIYELEK